MGLIWWRQALGDVRPYSLDFGLFKELGNKFGCDYTNSYKLYDSLYGT